VHHAPPNIYFSLNADVFECLLAEPILAQCLAAASYRTVRGTGREYAVYARLAHFVVTFRIDEEAHVRVEVPRRFADGADLYSSLVSVRYLTENPNKLTIFISARSRIGGHGESEVTWER
jgi:hypothetical protein